MTMYVGKARHVYFIVALKQCHDYGLVGNVLLKN